LAIPVVSCGNLTDNRSIFFLGSHGTDADYDALEQTKLELLTQLADLVFQQQQRRSISRLKSVRSTARHI
jgi:hypothetical protein